MIWATQAVFCGSYEEVAQRFCVNRGTVFYWTSKLLDPSFHSGTYGGARRDIFSDSERQVAFIAIWAYLKLNPEANLTNV